MKSTSEIDQVALMRLWSVVFGSPPLGALAFHARQPDRILADIEKAVKEGRCILHPEARPFVLDWLAHRRRQSANEAQGLHEKVEQLEQHRQNMKHEMDGLQQCLHKIVVVQQHESRQRDDELSKLKAQGFFDFARQLDPNDLLELLTILKHGDRTKAARALNMKVRTLHDHVKKWETKDAKYKLMADLVRWCKNSAGKRMVRLPDSMAFAGSGDDPENPKTNHSLQEEIANQGNSSYPDLIVKVIRPALLQMTDNNYKQVREELLEILSEEAPE